jgi:hypothetical protein
LLCGYNIGKLNFIWRNKRPRIVNGISKKKNKVRDLKLSDPKTCGNPYNVNLGK